MKRLLLILALVACGLPGSMLAQDRSLRTALDVLRPEARARVVMADTLLAFRTRTVPGGRLDVDAGVLRAAYRLENVVAPATTPETTARAYLAAAAPDFGWSREVEDLVLQSTTVGRYATHIVYQQLFRGLPVYNRQVKVSLNAEGRPTMVLSGYAPHLASVRSFNAQPTLTAEAAATQARDLAAAAGARTSTPELVVYPTKQPRLAWRLVAWPDDAPAEWEVLLDAHTGAVIRLFDQSTHAHPEHEGREASEQGRTGAVEISQTGKVSAKSDQSAIHNLQSTIVQGTGLVFDPDPLTTAGVEYGGAYVDANDADVDVLNAQRLEVPLNDITQGGDGLYRLEGPFVRVDGSSSIGGNASTPPAEADPNAFRYGRADDRFEAVMVYYHIDKSQRYVQSLNIGRPIQAVPVRVNPHGLGGADDSKYFLSQNAIALGDGGIDDAEDADVIWHEYGHALLQGSAPGLLNTPEGQALHEGWSDYWAASYSRGLIEAGIVPNRDWIKVFTWDGNQTWSGRLLNHTGRYPEDTPCARGSCGSGIYRDGDLWATTLMEIYTDLGREVIDRLNLASHGYLSAPTTFADAAQALIQADIDYYGGDHLGVLINHLGTRGYVDPSSFGPVVAHTPIPYVEQTGSNIVVEVDVTPVAAAIDRTTFFYSINGGAFQQLSLTDQGNDRFTGTLTLPASATEVRYYIEAEDSAGQRTLLPAGAPQQTFSFGVGPDTEAPQITHEPILQAAIQAWPALVVATVSDNQAVDTVFVRYTVRSAVGAVQAEGTFGLRREGGNYVGAFPVSADLLEEGSTVQYSIHARDVALQTNEAMFPSTGTLSFFIVSEGVLALYNFETDQGLTASGVWTRGVPTFGLTVAHSGQNVWATAPGGEYPASEQRSVLDLPPINLGNVNQAYLTFWHWYDFEHSGIVLPDEFTTESFWDGGNIKASINNGASWTVLEPQGGYNGVIEDGTGNPLEFEGGFGGYSYGWRRVIVPLPTANNLRIRFDFGSDSSNELNSLFYAGWYLDDMRISTDLLPDNTAPTVIEPPPDVIQVDAGQLPPPIVVKATDNVGLAQVLVDYQVIPASGPQTQGTLRLAMSLSDLNTFVGNIVPPQALGLGDRIEYRLTLRDFDGNTTVFPDDTQTSLCIEYRLAEVRGALSNVRASGLWQKQGQGWMTTTGAVEDRSSLVLEPFDLPDNAEAMSFNLTHRFSLGSSLGGNVKLSNDGGATWNVLAPTTGYAATFSPDGTHPMQGEGIFRGQTQSNVLHTFDLSPYAGQQVRLRIDFGATQAPAPAEFWSIVQAELRFSTLDNGFAVPRELALHPNFPDPFSDNTTISYTLPETMPVQLELYNMLGQRIAVLVDRQQDAGTYTVTMGRGSLASGVYLLRMMAGGTQKVERMVITR